MMKTIASMTAAGALSLMLLAGCNNQEPAGPGGGKPNKRVQEINDSLTLKHIGADCMTGAAHDDIRVPTIYDPICGADGKTYGNLCYAQLAGVLLVSDGVCGQNPPKCGTPDPDSGWVCTAEWAPVCGEDGKTYGNGCEAAGHKVKVAHPGECSPVVLPVDPTDPIGGPVDPGDGACIQVLVCGKDGKTYPTPCAASKVGVAYMGECAK